MGLERLEPRMLLNADWQNPLLRLDVDGDRVVAPIDVLIIINELNAVGESRVAAADGKLPVPTTEKSPPPFYDVNGDSFVSPLDALIVINGLNEDFEPPAIVVGLLNDTSPAGTNSDQLTFDPTLAGTVTDQIGVTSLKVQVNDGPLLDAAFDVDGAFTFDPGLAQDGTDDGLHSVRLVATDARGITSQALQFSFTLDTIAPAATLDIDAAFDTAVVGDRLTSFANVDLDGQTEADAVLSVAPLGLTPQLDANGRFTLAGIALSDGINPFTLEVTDAAGNTRTAIERIVRSDSANAFALVEGNPFAVELEQAAELGSAGEQRRLRVDLQSLFDRTDQLALVRDVVNIFVVDPSDASRTLLDGGRPGTPVFSLDETGATLAPGIASLQGSDLLIDVSSIAGEAGNLLFQLLSADTDRNSLIIIDGISAEVIGGSAAQLLVNRQLPVAPGGALDVSAFTPNPQLEARIRESRFDSTTGKVLATLTLTNAGNAVGRDVAVVLRNLPAGVTLDNPAGTLEGDPVVNLRNVTGSGGLKSGQSTAPVEISLNNPTNNRFTFDVEVIAGPLNRSPTFDTINPITVFPGEVLQVPLNANDLDGDVLTFSILPLPGQPPLPNMSLSQAGQITLRPSSNQIGAFAFEVRVSDGVATASQIVQLEVAADPVGTTRVSGQVLDVAQTPLVGMQVEIGAVQGLTDANGFFTLDLGNGPLVSDTVKIRGETFVDPARPDVVYPFIAEKLPLVLERDVLAGVNNVIARPIFLPKLDVASGQTIDPAQDITVTTAAIPNAEVFVAAGTLMNQQGTPFTGVLSITEVPPDLTPAALPANMFPDLVVTIQPGEMVFAAPAPLTLPNATNFPAGTLLDLMSINPVTGNFDLVGTGQVSNNGQRIETIDGGIRNSSWHFFVTQTPPQQEQANNDPVNNPRNQDQLCDDCEGKAQKSGESVATSDVELHSGALLEEHLLVTYQSLGVERGVSLHYDSLRADPRPIFHFNAVNASGDETLVASLNVSRGNVSVQVPGFVGNEFGLQGGEHFWDLPTGTNDVDAALQVDLRDQPTGVYDFNVAFGPRRFNGSRFSGSSSQFSTPVSIINSIDSPFGAGWDLAGLQQLFENPDGSVMLIDGGGAELLFQPQAAGQPFDSPAGDFSTFERLGDDTFRRTFPDQTVVQFNADNRIASVTDRNGNQTVFNYDADGFVTTIVDPVGLSTMFTRTGERITKITDPAVRETNLEYDAAGNLIRITDPDGSSRQFFYDDAHHLTQEINQRGFREEATYGFHGRVLETLRKDGTRSVFEPVQTLGLFPAELTSHPDTAPSIAVDGGQSIARFADPNGNVTTSVLDQAGQIVSQTDDEGNLPSVVRNRDNLQVVTNDGRGNGTYRKFDDRGNVIQVALEQNERSPSMFDGPVLLSHDRVEMVRLGDLDGDGDLDAVAGHGTTLNLAGSSQFVTIFKNDNGRLVRELDLQVSSAGTENIALADVDGDNILDILIATGDSANDRFRVMKGNGDLTFGFLSTIALTLDPTSLAVGDVNGDGSPDAIISRGSSNDAVLLINDGAGTFTESALPTGDRNFDVRLADVNGDGNLDAVFAGIVGVRLLLGDGAGGFSANIKLNTGSQTHDAVEVLDFNNDGRLDIIATAIFGVIQFFENDGVGGFIESAITVSVSGRLNDIAVADLNFDGFQDFVLSNNSSDAARVFLNDGLDRFSNQPQFVRSGRAASSVALGDLDQDGDFELLIGNDNSNDVSVVYGKGDGSFLDNPALPVFSGANPRPRSLEMADLDGDGNLDIVTALSVNNTIAVQLGDGAGGFSVAVEFPATSNPHDLAIGDVNADGVPDVVVTENGAGRAVLLLGQGSGVFSAPQPINGTANAGSVEIADVDGDGHTDIVFAGGLLFDIFFGQSDGTFPDTVSISRPNSCCGRVEDDFFQVVDLDGDDDLDIVAGADAFRLITNNGSRQFTLSSVGTNLTFTSVSKAKAVDLNGDGFVDLVGLGSGQAFAPRDDRSGIVVRLSDGTGGFQPGMAFTAGGQDTDGFAIVDLNLDGHLDVVTSTDADNSVSVLLGDGTGSFAEAEHFNIRSRSESSLALGDIDRDGDVDIVTPSFDNRNVTLLFNHTVFPCQEQTCQQTFEYDASFSQLTRTVDELGRQRLFEIDPATGNTLSETIVLGRPDATSGEIDDLVTQFTHTAQGLIDTVTDPLGRVTDFDYDAQGRQITTTFAKGTADEAVRRFEYDAAGNMTAEIDENNHRTEFEYDALNRVTLIRDALNGEREFTYDADGNVLQSFDELDQQTRFEYDAMNRLVKQIDDVGNSVAFEYDNFGNLTRQTDRLGRSNEFRYDARDRLVATVDAEGGTQRFRYDEDNNSVAFTDQNGHTSNTFYDQRDRTTHFFDPLNGLNRTLVDAAGFSVTDFDELGRRMDNLRDDADRLIEIHHPDPDGDGPATRPIWQFEFDEAGNTIAETDPLGHVTQFAYDNRNRLVQQTEADPDGAGPLTSPITQFEYDDRSLLAKVTDPLGRVTTFEYDALQRNIRTTLPDPDGAGPQSSPVTTTDYNAVDNVTSVTDALDNTTAFEYDTLNRRTRTTQPDPDGAGPLASPVLTVQYDAESQVLSVTDPLIRTTQFDYDRLGRQTREIAADPDGNGPLASPITQFAYDPVGTLIATIDPLGNQTDFEYDALDRRIRTIAADPDGAGPKQRPVDTQVFDAASQLVATIDPLGRRTDFAYDGLSRVIAIAQPDPDGAGPEVRPITQFEIDLLGNITAIIDPLGNRSENVYDNLNRLVQLTLPDPDGAGPASNPVSTLVFDAAGQIISTTDPLGRQTLFQFDDLGRIIQTTLPDPDGAGPLVSPIYLSSFDLVGNLTSLTDALGRVTTFEYDNLYRQVTVVEPDPDGAGPQASPTSRFTYDAAGQQLSASDPLQRVTSLTYDDLGRLIRKTDPDPDGAGPLTRPITTFEYDAVSNNTALVDPLGNVTRFEFDDLLRHVRTIDPDPDGAGPLASPITAFDYDVASQMVAETDPLGRTTTFEYDNLSRVIRRVAPDPDGAGPQQSPSESFVFDLQDNLLSTTDALGHATTYTYDNLYRRITETDANNDTTNYEYDLVGNRTAVVDALTNRTGYQYDDLNRLIVTTDPLGSTTQFAYDPVNNPVERMDRLGRVIRYSYDDLDRRVQEQWLDAGNVVRTMQYEFDVASQMIGDTDPDASHTYGYDDLGRMTQSVTTVTGFSSSVTFDYQYDAVGNKLRQEAATGTTKDFVNQYTFDNLYRKTQMRQSSGGGNAVAEKRIDSTYDIASQIDTLDRFADLDGTQSVASSTYVFDLASRLTELTHAKGGVNLADYAWTYDAANRITSFDSLADGLATFAYDARNQLTAADYAAQDDLAFTYDENGNRIGGGNVVGANNRTTSDETFDYEYDAEGNRTKRTNRTTGAVTEYTWDHRNRLIQVVERSSAGAAAGRIVTHAYDTMNRWVASRVDADGDGSGTAEPRFYFYEGNNIVLEFDGATASDLAHRYLWGVMVDQVLADEQVASPAQPGDILWTLGDNQGTIRDLVEYDSTTDTSTVVNHKQYDAFGNVTAETDATIDSLFGYTGRPFDAATGLQNNLNRWYDAVLGKWLSEDPIGFDGDDANLSRYVGNSPTQRIDPSGLINFEDRFKDFVGKPPEISPNQKKIADALAKRAAALADDAIEIAKSLAIAKKEIAESLAKNFGVSVADVVAQNETFKNAIKADDLAREVARQTREEAAKRAAKVADIRAARKAANLAKEASKSSLSKGLSKVAGSLGSVLGNPNVGIALKGLNIIAYAEAAMNAAADLFVFDSRGSNHLQIVRHQEEIDRKFSELNKQKNEKTRKLVQQEQDAENLRIEQERAVERLQDDVIRNQHLREQQFLEQQRQRRQKSANSQPARLIGINNDLANGQVRAGDPFDLFREKPRPKPAVTPGLTPLEQFFAEIGENDRTLGRQITPGTSSSISTSNVSRSKANSQRIATELGLTNRNNCPPEDQPK